MQPTRATAAGLGLALLSALTFATSGTFARSLLEAGWSAQAAVIVRVGSAALLLALPAAWALRGRWGLLRRNLGTIGLFGLLAVAAVQVCFFNAVRYLPVGVALLLEYLGVILVVGWLWAVHRQRPRRLTAAGSVVAVVGLVLVLDLVGGARLDPVGVLWGLGAASGLAGFFLLSARGAAGTGGDGTGGDGTGGDGIGGSGTGLPPVVLAGGGMAVGAAILLALGVVGVLPLTATFGEVTFAGNRTSWLVPAVGLSLLSAIVAYVAGIGATRTLGPRLASFVGLTEVMFAILIAWLVLSELPTLIQLFGGLCIVGGVALVRLDELAAAKGERLPDAPMPGRHPWRSARAAPQTGQSSCGTIDQAPSPSHS